MNKPNPRTRTKMISITQPLHAVVEVIADTEEEAIEEAKHAVAERYDTDVVNVEYFDTAWIDTDDYGIVIQYA